MIEWEIWSLGVDGDGSRFEFLQWAQKLRDAGYRVINEPWEGRR